METLRPASTVERCAVTRSPEETRELGAQLALLLQPGDVVALRGDLGAGKTCLIQGVCQGLQVDDVVNSPTFMLVNEYAGRIGAMDIPVYHFDLYRLAHPAELVDLGVEDYLSAGGVSLFEWAERGAQLLPRPRWDVGLEQTADDERRISWTYGTQG
jgi:tRNA threonylcarbamoyladenosine biosynthesis protein TsaE